MGHCWPIYLWPYNVAKIDSPKFRFHLGSWRWVKWGLLTACKAMQIIRTIHRKRMVRHTCKEKKCIIKFDIKQQIPDISYLDVSCVLNHFSDNISTVAVTHRDVDKWTVFCRRQFLNGFHLFPDIHYTSAVVLLMVCGAPQMASHYPCQCWPNSTIPHVVVKIRISGATMWWWPTLTMSYTESVFMGFLFMVH